MQWRHLAANLSNSNRGNLIAMVCRDNGVWFWLQRPLVVAHAGSHLWRVKVTANNTVSNSSWIKLLFSPRRHTYMLYISIIKRLVIKRGLKKDTYIHTWERKQMKKLAPPGCSPKQLKIEWVFKTDTIISTHHSWLDLALPPYVPRMRPHSKKNFAFFSITRVLFTSVTAFRLDFGCWSRIWYQNSITMQRNKTFHKI